MDIYYRNLTQTELVEPLCCLTAEVDFRYIEIVQLIKYFFTIVLFLSFLFLSPVQVSAVTATGAWSSGDEYVTCGGTVNYTFPAKGGSATGTYSGICDTQNIKLGGRFSGNFTGGWGGTLSGSFNGWHSFTSQGNTQSFDLRGSWRGSIRKNGTMVARFTDTTDIGLDGDVHAVFSVSEFEREFVESIGRGGHDSSSLEEYEEKQRLEKKFLEEQSPENKIYYYIDGEKRIPTTKERLERMPVRYDPEKMANRSWPRFYFGEGDEGGWLLEDDEDIGYFEEMVVDAILAKDEFFERLQDAPFVAYDAFIERFGEETKKGQVFETKDGTVVWVGQDGTLVEMLKEDLFTKEQREKLDIQEDVIALGGGKIVIDNSGDKQTSTESFVFLTSKENQENGTEGNEEKTAMSKLIFGNKSIVEYVFDKETAEIEVKVYQGEAIVYEFDPANFTKKTLVTIKPGESLKVGLVQYAKTGIKALDKQTFDLEEKNPGIEKIKQLKQRAENPTQYLLIRVVFFGGAVILLLVLLVKVIFIFKNRGSKKRSSGFRKRMRR